MLQKSISAAQKGLSAIHVTPFDASGRVDCGLLEGLVDRLISAGIDNLVTGGNTGEFYSLSMGEIREVYRTAISTAAGRCVVTASTGRSLSDAIQIAEFSAAFGADALMIHQINDPFASAVGTIAYVRAIADAVPLPIVLYMRNDNFETDELLELVDHPRILAVKYAVPDPIRLAGWLRLTAERQLLWVCGLAEAWAVPFSSIGAVGFTSGLVNVHPSLSLAVRDALTTQDYASARELIRKIAPFEALRAQDGNGANVTVVKEAMRLLGFEVGSVRPPGRPDLTPSARAELAEILCSWGLPIQRAA